MGDLLSPGLRAVLITSNPGPSRLLSGALRAFSYCVMRSCEVGDGAFGGLNPRGVWLMAPFCSCKEAASAASSACCSSVFAPPEAEPRDWRIGASFPRMPCWEVGFPSSDAVVKVAVVYSAEDAGCIKLLGAVRREFQTEPVFRSVDAGSSCESE